MALNKIVQVYFTGENGPNSYTKIDYSSVTDILYAFMKVSGNGSLVGYSHGSPDNLISYAHSKGVRVILSFQSTDGNTLVTDPNARNRAVNNLLNEVKSRGFDGIDNDIEIYGNRDGMTAFMQGLYSAFKSSNSNYRVSVAVHNRNAGGTFDGPIIKNYVDYLMIMAYDICDSSSTVSGPVAPMDNPDRACYGSSVNIGIDYWKNTAQVPVNKILLGVPYYGFLNRTNSGARLAQASSHQWVNADDFTSYNHTKYFDSAWQTPWQAWQSGGWYQLQYEDIQSYNAKYNAALSNNLAGIGIWTIDYGLNRTDLSQLIKDKFGGGPIVKYRCTGSPNWQCVEDPNGPYNSLAECQNACKEPIVKYRCTGSPNWQCVEDPNGPYNSLAECQAVCKPQTKKFKISTIGTPSNPSGVLVMKSSRGDYTTDEACKAACKIINDMSVQDIKGESMGNILISLEDLYEDTKDIKPNVLRNRIQEKIHRMISVINTETNS